MSKLDITDRLTFLAEKFDVFDTEDMEVVKAKCDGYVEDGWESSYPAKSSVDKIIGIVSTKFNKRGFPIVKVSVAYEVFTAMVGADPTANKICLQWMLNTFTRFLKDKEWVEASRFAVEDLPQANEYLTLFEANKRKKKFRDMAVYSLKGFKDITNINEYRSLGQLFDAVDPFIKRDPSEMESLMNRYVDTDQAVIPFRDRRYTVFIPLTRDANTIFNNFAGWCTAKTGNSMFEDYTNRHKKPNGNNSNIYIVIDNGFFNGENENIYQIHFETNQIKDRSNSRNIDLYSLVLKYSDGLTNFFGDELKKMANEYNGSLNDNKYVDTLMDFGFTDILFEFFDVETNIILIDSETAVKKRVVPRIPDVTRFTNLTHLVILDSSVHELHKSIGSLAKLKNLTLSGNNIEVLPTEISKLKNLIFLNLMDNPIKTIPNEIKYLDSSNGGSLVQIAISKEKISDANYQKLRKLLPNTIFD
jgi:Leucine-rich repeat (LRR) protein